MTLLMASRRFVQAPLDNLRADGALTHTSSPLVLMLIFITLVSPFQACVQLAVLEKLAL
jgi:hypothetical protein